MKLSDSSKMDDSWTTMMSRSARNATTNAYVPIHLRANAGEEEKKKHMDIESAIQFPTLGKVPARLAKGVWGAKTSFKTTVQQMIVNEQKTTEEREAEAERQRAMEGWEVLDCPKTLTTEWGYAFNHYISVRNHEADRIQHLMDIGYWVDPIVVKERSATKAVVDVNAIREWTDEMNDDLSLGEEDEEDPDLDTFGE